MHATRAAVAAPAHMAVVATHMAAAAANMSVVMTHAAASAAHMVAAATQMAAAAAQLTAAVALQARCAASGVRSAPRAKTDDGGSKAPALTHIDECNVSVNVLMLGQKRQ